jgi:hypothetical protein
MLVGGVGRHQGRCRHRDRDEREESTRRGLLCIATRAAVEGGIVPAAESPGPSPRSTSKSLHQTA